MAGLGRKVFNAGEVLSAANVQGYLQDQVVQVYSGTAARSSALGTAVSEGMMSYLTDSNELSVYTSNGTAAWAPVSLHQSSNLIINGAFDIWQRGTSFTSTGYFADRWYASLGGTTTFSQNTDIPSGLNAQYSAQWLTGATSSFGQFYYALESADVKAMRGQTFMFSFYVKTAGSMAGNVQVQVNYSNSTDALVSQSTSVTGAGDTSFTASSVTSWTRKYVWITVPSDAVGLRFGILPDTVQASGVTCRIAGVQLEAGSVATPFRRSSPTLQSEVLACQRYYERRNFSPSALGPIGTGVVVSGNTAAGTHVYTATSMRVAPTLTFSGTIRIYDGSTAPAVTSISSYGATFNGASVDFVASGGGMTNGRAATVIGPGSGTGYIEFSAEL